MSSTITLFFNMTFIHMCIEVPIEKLISWHKSIIELDFMNFSAILFLVYGPGTETLPPPGDFCRPIYLKTIAYEILKSDCLQVNRWWVWSWRAFEDRYPMKIINIGFSSISVIYSVVDSYENTSFYDKSMKIGTNVLWHMLISKV